VVAASRIYGYHHRAGCCWSIGPLGLLGTICLASERSGRGTEQVRVGRIEFCQVERMPLTNDPRLMEVRYPFNDNAKALEQLQKIVADLTERVERLETELSLAKFARPVK